MTGSQRILFAIAVLAVTAAAVGVARFAGGGDDDDLVVVRGTIGSEKVGFLGDPEVQEILADRYGLRVEFGSAGSLEMMESAPSELDYLWPGSYVARDIYEERYGPARRAQSIFNSPVILYSWAPVADALEIARVVQEVDGTYYITDFPYLIEMIEDGTSWTSLGLPQLFGSINIITTDSTTSASGNNFAGLLASTFNGGQVIDDTTVESVLGRVEAFYARLGQLELSTRDLFAQYLNEGMGAFPIIAGYESSLTEFSPESESAVDLIQDEIRLLYPLPTVWSSHPFLALTENGERLLAALDDDEFQRIAWESHGFRSGVLDIQTNPQVLEIAGVPETVDSVQQLPEADVMRRITQGLRFEESSPATPVPASATPPATPATVSRRALGARL